MAGKFSGYLLCSDFDGTITTDGKTVTPENLEAIRYFTSEGGYFTMATGRFPDHFIPMSDFGINAPVIALGGSVIADITDGVRVISEKNISPEIIRRLGADFMDGRIPDVVRLIIHSDSSSVTLTPGDPANPERLSIALSRPVCKFIVMEEPAIGAELRVYMESRFSELDFEMSWPAGLEGFSSGVCKGSAVKELRSILYGIHTVVCVGDYENDISMLKYADIGYAPSNAFEKTKAAADRITVSCRENAVAAIISELCGE